MKGLFLEKPGLLKEALKREEEWSKQVPGYNTTIGGEKIVMTSLEHSLFKLRAEHELGEWADQFIDPEAELEDDGNDGIMGRPMQIVEDEAWVVGMEELRTGGQFDPDAAEFHEDNGFLLDEDDNNIRDERVVANLISNQPCVTSIPSGGLVPELGEVPI
jgi:hypothetical protein